MKLSALSIFFVALCLGLTVGQVQLRVYRGTLVHSRVLEQIEILQNHLLGFDESNLGEVSAAACIHAYIIHSVHVYTPMRMQQIQFCSVRAYRHYKQPYFGRRNFARFNKYMCGESLHILHVVVCRGVLGHGPPGKFW